MKFGAKHLNDLFVLDGIYNVNARDKILREIISNSLAHRDYSSAFPAKLVIEKYRIFTENSNISKKIGKLDLENFNPVSKNPLIAKIFREIGLADELGSGMRNTNKYTSMYSKALPIFEEGDVFKTIIPLKEIATLKVGGFVNDTQNISPNERLSLIIKLIKQDNKITREMLSKQLKVSKTTISRDIKKLQAKQKLEYVGSSKSGHWKIINKK